MAEKAKRPLTSTSTANTKKKRGHSAPDEVSVIDSKDRHPTKLKLFAVTAAKKLKVRIVVLCQVYY
jgi:hypothetical protein